MPPEGYIPSTPSPKPGQHAMLLQQLAASATASADALLTHHESQEQLNAAVLRHQANAVLLASHLADFQLAQQALKEFESGW